MFRKYVWICGLAMCLGTAMTACGKEAETSGPAMAAAEAGMTEGTVVPERTDAEQAAEETVEFHGEYYLKSEISEETLKWLAHYQSLPEEDRLCINYIPHEFVKNQGSVKTFETAGDSAAWEGAEREPVPSVDILLTSAPELTLVDPLSSTWYRFAIQSGNYEWSVVKDGEVQSVIACGSHPLDRVTERTERLKVPKYQRMDEVVYMVNCTVPPDRLTLVQWDVSALGDTEAAAEETRTYEGDTNICLKDGKVYEITAEWDSEKLKERGFSGTASYGVITE